MKAKNRTGKKEVSVFPRQYRETNYSSYRLVSAVGILVIVALLLMIGAQYVKQCMVKDELAEYEARIDELEIRREMLKGEIERLQDPEYIEVMARDRLGLVKPGEEIFQLGD
ncbi:MAG: septum formation initiator family protein [Bacillota bacterium]|nr:septum formation initiator family protein [Bacillota bacterium]